MKIITHVEHDGEVGDTLEDAVPGSDILHPLRQRSPHLRHVLVGVQTDLHHVIDESTERRQRESSHEQCDESVLNHCRRGKCVKWPWQTTGLDSERQSRGGREKKDIICQIGEREDKSCYANNGFVLSLR